jgi:NTE family protein
MIAFVLSGGGNRGALEAGALIALFERGIQPDILVGTSAGAMNAAFIAINPTLDGAKQLGDRWEKINKEMVFPGNYLTMAWRFLTGADSISPNDNLRQYVESQLPPGIRTFGDIRNVRLYTTTSNLNTAELYVFGDDPTALLLDAVLCSAAVPPLLPPILFNGFQYVDGAVGADVPISIAAAKGATEIYALDVGLGAVPRDSIHGVANIGQRVIGLLVHRQLIDDFEEVQEDPALKLHYLAIQSYPDIGDFDHAKLFVAEGYRLTKDFLDGKPPSPLGMASMETAAPSAPPGAVKWERKK